MTLRFLLLTAALLAAACSAPGRVRVVIEPEEIKSSLDESFPLSGELSVARLELTDPELILTEGSDELGLRLKARVTVAILAVEGTVTVKGKLRYQPEERTFYLDDPQIVDLTVPGLPEEDVPNVLATANDALRATLPKVPVYRLEEGATQMLLRSMKVENGQVVAELGI